MATDEDLAELNGDERYSAGDLPWDSDSPAHHLVAVFEHGDIVPGAA